MRRLLAVLLLLALPALARAQGSEPKATVKFLTNQLCTAAAGCTANWGNSLGQPFQDDPASGIAVYQMPNGSCIATTTRGGTAPTAFDIFIQVCPDQGCTLSSGNWDDYARFTMGTGSSSHVVAWTATGGQLHGHALCQASTAVTAGTCAGTAQICGTPCNTTSGCLPPDCVRGYYMGDRVRIATVLTGGDGTTTETFSLTCFMSGST